MASIAGIILAAGQSKRMQWPMALLPLPSGKTLLEDQVALLKKSGCDPIIVITGAHTTITREELPTLDVMWGHNPRWQGGVFTSLQIGLQLALGQKVDGALILPIDIVGVKPETFR